MREERHKLTGKIVVDNVSDKTKVVYEDVCIDYDQQLHTTHCIHRL